MHSEIDCACCEGMGEVKIPILDLPQCGRGSSKHYIVCWVGGYNMLDGGGAQCCLNMFYL